MEALPNVPPIADSVPGYEGSGWTSLVGPKNTPAEAVERLNKEVNAIMADPAMKQHLLKLGVEAVKLSSAETGKLIADASVKWAKVVKFAGIKAE